MILRDILFQPCNSIFINNNGEQVMFKGKNKLKDVLNYLGGKELIPFHIENEVKADYLQVNHIYSVVNDQGFIYVNLVTYKEETKLNYQKQ